MAVVMIGVDPHKASHTAVAVNAAEQSLGQLRVRASAVTGLLAVMTRPATSEPRHGKSLLVEPRSLTAWKRTVTPSSATHFLSCKTNSSVLLV